MNDIKDRPHIEITEEKTCKTKKQMINGQLKKDLDKYISGKDDEEYLYKCRQSDNQPNTRMQAYRILRKAADKLEIEKIGTHSLRKTFGYHHYKEQKDVAMLQKLFNHGSPGFTHRHKNNEDIDVAELKAIFNILIHYDSRIHRVFFKF
ncbi:Phage integrase family protein [Halarsenatibacter silvermanii]|uniref:Phage integrase family protein n=1 Tax=Halarsenatibacter silvermanii TaxID=321763 RepID=A0A1G9PGB1_9FIRM|nr:Phage integrase family protein [Halarsenatibacter silvermanii]